jgi:hypothetical protein
MASGAEGDGFVGQDATVGDHANVGAGGSRESEIESGRGSECGCFGDEIRKRGRRRGLRQGLLRGSERAFRGTVGGVASPSVDTSGNKSGDDEQNEEKARGDDPLWRRRNGIWRGWRCDDCVLAVGEVVFGEEMLLAEAEIARDDANEAAIEDAAGKFFPVFVFESLQEPHRHASLDGELVKRDFAQLALAFQQLTEAAFGHGSRPCSTEPVELDAAAEE